MLKNNVPRLFEHFDVRMKIIIIASSLLVCLPVISGHPPGEYPKYEHEEGVIRRLQSAGFHKNLIISLLEVTRRIPHQKLEQVESYLRERGFPVQMIDIYVGIAKQTVFNEKHKTPRLGNLDLGFVDRYSAFDFRNTNRAGSSTSSSSVGPARMKIINHEEQHPGERGSPSWIAAAARHLQLPEETVCIYFDLLEFLKKSNSTRIPESAVLHPSGIRRFDVRTLEVFDNYWKNRNKKKRQQN